jgi:hypothetical protein
MPPGVRGENMSQGRGTPNRRDAERGARTSGGAVGLHGDLLTPSRSKLRGAESVFTGPASKLAGGGTGEPVASAAGNNPWRGEAQGSSGPAEGTTLRSCNGLPEGARPRSRARASVEAFVRSSRRQVGKTASRGAVPLREGESFEGPYPTSGRGMKQGRGGRGRRKAPGGRKNPEGATDRARQPRSWWAAAIASAEGARTPWEWPHPRGSRQPVSVEL